MVKSLLKARALLLVASALVGTASAASAVSPSLLLVAALSAGAASAAAPAAGAFAVTWLTPTAEPGKTEDGRASYAGSMPMGNGALTAAAWANTSIGGLSIYVGHQNAMSSATELFKLARIEVSLSPNPFSAGAFFNQTLDIESGTFHLWLGGSSAATALAHLRVWVDANADSLYVDVSTPAGSPVSLTARVLSVRPSAPWTYTPPFFCSSVNSTPDVLVDPLPPARAYAAAPPQSAADAVRHATGARRPARTLQPPPAAVAFQPGSVVIYHRNVDSDGLTVPTVLEQQGLLGLLGVTPDHWRDLQFGLALDAGAGPALARTSPSSLASTAPGTAFTLRATALAVQTDSVDEWLADLAALVTTAAPDPRPAHDAWWAAFTARSYVAVNASAWGGLSDGFTLSQMYAVTRYTQAVQSRGTIWPIKFNGMAVRVRLC